MAYVHIVVRRRRARDNFEESKHPRASNGEFSETAGSGRAAMTEVSNVTEKGQKRTMANGSPLPAHVAKLVIPPAWTDVKVSSDPKSHLLAVGRDSKGRQTVIYSKDFSAKQAATKFARVQELDQKYDAIRDENSAARKSANAKVAEAADVTALIMATGIRPGSETDTGAKVQAYGATTLKGSHVVVTPDGVSLRFTGKKGVALNLPVADTEIANMLIDRKNKAGDDGQLFAVNEKTLLDHVHTLDGGSFKTKDFRTLLGTKTAMDAMSKLPAPKTEAEYKKATLAVAKEVSEKLGNTPTVALQSYINPAVFARWRIAA